MTGLNGVTLGSPVQTVDPDGPDPDEGPRCLACVHLWSAHTPIDVRFCTATLAMSHQRGCVCSPVPRR
jgi:hypothetical protein